jgi:glycogen(starch) synthase
LSFGEATRLAWRRWFVMRILFISNYYPPFEVGSYEQLCKDVADRLAAQGHQVAILTSDHQGEGRRAGTGEGIYRQLRIGPSSGRGAAPWLEFFTARRAKTRRNLESFRRVLDEFQPEVVFIWNLQGLPTELAEACERRQELTVAYWLAGYTPAEPDGYWRYWEGKPAGFLPRLVKSLLGPLAFRIMAAEGKPIRPRMQHAAVVSHYMRETHIAAGTLPADARVITNGVDYERFYRPVGPREETTLKLLVAGRVSNDKGVHTAVDALAHLAGQPELPKATLSIAGSGSLLYRRELQAHIAANKLEDSVQFLGFFPREEMPRLMFDHDVLLLPSIYPEAFSRVVLEGMAAGLAVVGSTAGGTCELILDGQNGHTFAPEDSAGLASKLSSLLKDDSLRQRLARAGQKQVEEAYTLEIMVTRIEQFLEEALLEDNGLLATSVARRRRYGA